MMNELEHLGHLVDGNGVRPSPSKSEAIRDATRPRDLAGLESWLGMAQYYARFVPNFSTLAGPLNSLRRKNAEFKWGETEQHAFDVLKSELASSQLLVHFDDRLPLCLAADASAYGIGALLFHIFADGTERPVACASRTLTDAERKYSQIEKEGLGIVFGCKRFEKYLYGRRFTLFTDHRPLTHIFHPSTAVGHTALQRIQRWSLYLQNFDYSIEFRNGKSNFNADAMSRSPLPAAERFDVEVHAVHESHINEAPVDAARVRQCTRRDPILSRLLDLTQHGWGPKCPDDALKPYWTR